MGILRLELGDPGFAAEATPDLGSRGGFEKEVNGFPQVGQGGFRGVSLAGDIQIRIEGDVLFALFADDGGEAGFHSTNLNRAVTESNWVGVFDETDPIRLWSDRSEPEVEWVS